MNDHEPYPTADLYPIGDAARRSGLSVSAVRFYADAGIVAPTALNQAGHRLYDIDTVARLELVRTLREVDTDLGEIRLLLDGERTLHELLTTHLEVIERQERTLRSRRAVLRALLKQGGTTARADLMHRLVAMTDEEREQVIDDFWNDVSLGLDVPEGFVDRLRSMRPVLPTDPTAAQLEAWIELADLVQDQDFRDAVRTFLQDTHSTSDARTTPSQPFQDFIYGAGWQCTEELLAAHRSGEHPRSARSQQAVARAMEAARTLSGKPVTPENRDHAAGFFRMIPELKLELELESAEEEALFDGPVYEDTHGRYVLLVAMINGTEDELDHDTFPFVWFADAIQASAPEDHDAHGSATGS